ncbi:MAG: hypothetical protein H8D80_01510 [Proteobacteria bacterium]|nr:hypothetical protein [Pseudomonadota bacterium]
MTKKEWLEELVTVDEWGRDPSLADVPLTLMPRKKVFELRQYDKKTIEGMWKIYLTYLKETVDV